jgi:predicted nucleotidyltransferase
MISLIDQHRSELDRLCRESRVRRLDLFGSAASGDFDAATSDLDFIVTFADTGPGYANRYLAFAEALEALFGRRVDLLTERAIRNPIFRRSVERTRECIYEQRSEQAAA